MRFVIKLTTNFTKEIYALELKISGMLAAPFLLQGVKVALVRLSNHKIKAY
jgi:hypothetical protein